MLVPIREPLGDRRRRGGGRVRCEYRWVIEIGVAGQLLAVLQAAPRNTWLAAVWRRSRKRNPMMAARVSADVNTVRMCPQAVPPRRLAPQTARGSCDLGPLGTERPIAAHCPLPAPRPSGWRHWRRDPGESGVSSLETPRG